METVLFEKELPVGWITLNNPEKRNALSLQVMSTLISTLEKASQKQDIHVLILQGNGPAFCAGHDLKELTGPEKDLHHFRKVFSLCSELMKYLHKLPQPVIAKVHGIATAAGCQLVAACDLAIAESQARFATPGVKIGLFCTTPMTPLIRLIGRRRAMDMLMTGRFVQAEEAKSFGLVNKVVPLEDLDKAAKDWAMEIGSYSRYTLSLGKEAFYSQADLPEAQAYGYTKEVIAMNCLAEDAQEGMGAFLEKRKPQWKNK